VPKATRRKSPSVVFVPFAPPASQLLRDSLREIVMSLAKAPHSRGFVLSGFVKATREMGGQVQVGPGVDFVSPGYFGEWVLERVYPIA